MADEDDERGFFQEQPAGLGTGKAKTLAPASAGTTRTDKPGADKPSHDGHRERLRDRFRKAGSEALSDYEMLELLLFRSIPRADTKARAKALLKRFGTLAEVLGAPERLLREVEDVGAAAALDLKIVAAAAQRMARSSITGREILSSGRR